MHFKRTFLPFEFFPVVIESFIMLYSIVASFRTSVIRVIIFSDEAVDSWIQLGKDEQYLSAIVRYLQNQVCSKYADKFQGVGRIMREV